MYIKKAQEAYNKRMKKKSLKVKEGMSLFSKWISHKPVDNMYMVDKKPFKCLFVSPTKKSPRLTNQLILGSV